MAESQTNFSDDALLGTELSVPPMAEQQRIVAALDPVAAQIRAAERLVAKLSVVRSGFLDAQMDTIPASAYQPLVAICISDICYGIVQPGPFIHDGVPVLAIRDLHGDFATGVHRAASSLDAQYVRSRVLPDDVLVSIKGTIGRVAVVPPEFRGNISRDMAKLRFSNDVLPEFARNYFESNHGQRALDLAVVGTTRAEVSIHTLKKLTIPVPSIRNQEEIVDYLSMLDRARIAASNELAKLRLMSRGLAADVLTGRVRAPAGAEL